MQYRAVGTDQDVVTPAQCPVHAHQAAGLAPVERVRMAGPGSTKDPLGSTTAGASGLAAHPLRGPGRSGIPRRPAPATAPPPLPAPRTWELVERLRDPYRNTVP